MKSSKVLFLLLLVITTWLWYNNHYACAQITMTTCSQTNYTAASNYSDSLRDLSSRLVNSSSSLLYASESESQGKAFGMFQCRGDLTPAQCLACVNSTLAVAMRQKCPLSVGANVQQDECHVQYDDSPAFFNGTGSSSSSSSSNTQLEAISDTFTLCSAAQMPDLLYQLDVQRALQNVTTSAPLADNRYAATREGVIYALAQCDGYLSPPQCSDCFTSLLILKNTQCNQSRGGRMFYGHCSCRFENYLFFQPLTPFPPLPSPPSAKGGSMAGGTIAAFVFFGVCVCTILVYMHKRGIFNCNVEAPLEGDDLTGCLPQATVFSYKELKKATRGFYRKNKLGEGGFGPVYKGKLSDGREVAIKKLAVSTDQGKREFVNEVNIITSVQHRNLIKLYGCCVKGSKRLLVYEYLPNKSLDLFLFNCNEGEVLDWQRRLEIIQGIGRGLAYLHEDSQIRIIHRDIKPSNILLDNELVPKIADFGLARLFSHEVSLITTTIAGTLGYLSPEYAMHGVLTEKNDVFSFGIVALEIVSGRENADFTRPPDQQRLLDWAWKCYNGSEELQLLDERLTDHSIDKDEVIRVIHVALLCTQSYPSDRPSMSKALQLLAGQSERLETPNMPAYAAQTSYESVSFSSIPFSCNQSVPASDQGSCISQVMAR